MYRCYRVPKGSEYEKENEAHSHEARRRRVCPPPTEHDSEGKARHGPGGNDGGATVPIPLRQISCEVLRLLLVVRVVVQFLRSLLEAGGA